MKKLLLAIVALFALVGCSADPEAKTAKECSADPEAKTAREWVREALIEDYVGDDEVVFHFEDDYQVYLGGENLGNYFKWENECDYFAIISVEVILLSGGRNKNYIARIGWNDSDRLTNACTNPRDQKISDEDIVGAIIHEIDQE